MLMSLPPGYSPSPVNRQNIQLLGVPGNQGTQVLGGKLSTGFTPSMPSLGSTPLAGNSLNQNNTQMMAKALKGS